MDAIQQPQQQLSEQELKRRRREKILARSNLNRESQTSQPDPQPQSQSYPTSTQPQPFPQPISAPPSITAFQMFRISQAHDRIKNNLQYVAIIIGICSAQLHFWGLYGQAVFGLCLLFVVAATVFIQVKRAKSIRIFTEENEEGVDPLISKISSIKLIQVANKVLDLRTSITPVLKYLAAYLLTTIIMGLCLGEKQL